MPKLTSESAAQVLWLTGLSGAGKSTLAALIAKDLKSQGIACVLLDGDQVREAIDPELGHSPEARLKNAYRLARLSKLISNQGVTVICATMSLFPEIWSWNREHIPHYHQIYLRSDKKTLEERDNKGLYKRAREGTQQNIIGWDLEFEEPVNSDLIIETAQYGLDSLPNLSRKIIAEMVLPQSGSCP